MSNNTKKNASNVETANTEEEKAVLPNQVTPEDDMETAVNEVFEKVGFKDRLKSLTAKVKENKKAIGYTAAVVTVAGLALVKFVAKLNDSEELEPMSDEDDAALQEAKADAEQMADMA